MAVTYSITKGDWNSQTTNWRLKTTSNSSICGTGAILQSDTLDYSVSIGDNIDYLFFQNYHHSSGLYECRGVAFSVTFGNLGTYNILNNAIQADIDTGNGYYNGSKYEIKDGNYYSFSSTQSDAYKQSAAFTLNLSNLPAISKDACNMNSDGTFYITIIINTVLWHTSGNGTTFKTTINIPVNSVTIDSYSAYRETQTNTDSNDTITLKYSFSYPTSFYGTSEINLYEYKITGTNNYSYSSTITNLGTPSIDSSNSNRYLVDGSLPITGCDASTQYDYTLSLYRNSILLASQVLNIAPTTPVVHMAGRSSGGIGIGQKVSLNFPAMECNYPAYFYKSSYFPGGIPGVTTYSTEEVDTGGVWVDGKSKIYVRTVCYDSVGAESVSPVMTLTNYKEIIDIRGMLTNATPITQAFPHLSGIRAYVEDGIVKVQNSTSKKISAGHVTVWYTKNE